MKKIEKESKASGAGHKIVFILGAISLVIAIIVYGGLIFAENAVLGKYDKTIVYVAKENIAKGSKVNEDLFETKQLDTAVVPENVLAVVDIDKVADTYAVIDIGKGNIITKNLFASVLEEEKGTKMIGIPAESIADSVNGIVRTSDYIDIYLVSKEYDKDEVVLTESYIEDISGNQYECEREVFADDVTPLFEHIYVDGCFDANGVRIANEDAETCATSFNVVLEKEDADKIVSALASDWKIYITKCK